MEPLADPTAPGQLFGVISQPRRPMRMETQVIAKIQQVEVGARQRDLMKGRNPRGEMPQTARTHLRRDGPKSPSSSA